jgi:hypothetical protein
MMNTKALEVKKKVLEDDLAVALKKYAATAEQRRTTLDEANRVLLDAQLKKLESDLIRIEQELQEVESKLQEVQSKRLQPGDTYRKQALIWDQRLPKMDYQKARQIAKDVLTRFEDKEGAVLFMLQRSHEMCGQWCLAALREMIDEGNGKFIPHNVKFTALERPSEIELLNKLGHCLDAAVVENDIAASVTAVIDKLYDAVQSGGTVFVSIEFPDGQNVSPTFFKWFVEEFWCALVQSSKAAANKCELFKVIIAIVVSSSLPEECVQAYLGSLDAAFDFRKILELPLENWTSEEIRTWLVKHSGLTLSKVEFSQIALTIYNNSRAGVPVMAYTYLLDHLNTLHSSNVNP